MEMEEPVMTTNPLQELTRLGQSPWLDFIDRKLLESGDLAELIESASVRGITSNPAIFEKAIADTHAYDADIRRLAHPVQRHQQSSRS